ncbi:unnamed protein product [Caretta caretta]
MSELAASLLYKACGLIVFGQLTDLTFSFGVWFLQRRSPKPTPKTIKERRGSLSASKCKDSAKTRSTAVYGNTQPSFHVQNIIH